MPRLFATIAVCLALFATPAWAQAPDDADAVPQNATESAPAVTQEAAESPVATDAAPAPDDDAYAVGIEGPYARNWRQLMADGEHEAAADLAGTWVADATRRFGEEDYHTFLPLIRLAQAHERAGDLGAALRAYDGAVTVGERRLGVFDPALVEPLTGMGRVLANQGDHEAAVSRLMRAKDITHRNAGIFNEQQIEIVDILTEAYVGLGELRQATREQHFIFAAQEKIHGPDSLALIPALQKWAQWNARTNRFADARRLYHRAIETLEKNYGPNDLRLIETLNMIARSFYRNPTTSHPREGAYALQRAVEIYKAQEFVDQADLLRAQTRLGDWFMLSGLRSRSIEEYEKAVGEALEAGVDEELIDTMYGYPKLLRTNKVPIGVLARQVRQVSDGPRHILVEFDVDKRGRARNIRVIEDTVDLVSVVQVVRERIALSTFRPRFENGEPVVTHGVRKLFQFEVGDTDAVPQDPPAES